MAGLLPLCLADHDAVCCSYPVVAAPPLFVHLCKPRRNHSIQHHLDPRKRVCNPRNRLIAPENGMPPSPSQRVQAKFLGWACSAVPRALGAGSSGRAAVGRRRAPTPCSPSNAASTTTDGPTSSIGGPAAPQPPGPKILPAPQANKGLEGGRSCGRIKFCPKFSAARTLSNDTTLYIISMHFTTASEAWPLSPYPLARS